MSREATARSVVGAVAVASAALYFLSDLIEVLQGGFSDAQLLLTLVAEAVVPFVLIGLCMVQRPRFGPLGEGGALAYAGSYVFFTFTVVYALVAAVPDYAALGDELGALMFAAGALMVVGGIALGAEILRSGAFPRWTALSLIAGVVLVAATQAAPAAVQLLPAALRDAAFAGFGLSLLPSGARLRLPALRLHRSVRV